MKHFVFGYGSLICPRSRAITAPTLEGAAAEPVAVAGIERTWSARVNFRRSIPGREHIRGCTPMGVRFARGAKCNGVLIRVDEEELGRFDAREAGYVRKKMDLADVYPHVDSDKLIGGSMPLWPTETADVVGDDVVSLGEEVALEDVRCPECRLVFKKASEKRRQCRGTSSACDSSQECEDIAVWVYVQAKNFPADRSFPIAQSYVDIIMRGCLSISHDFTRRFLETTHGWWHDGLPDNRTGREQILKDEDEPKADDNSNERRSIEKHYTWVNDRHAPMYIRADCEYSLRNGNKIDELIKEHHPYALQQRVLWCGLRD